MLRLVPQGPRCSAAPRASGGRPQSVLRTEPRHAALHFPARGHSRANCTLQGLAGPAVKNASLFSGTARRISGETAGPVAAHHRGAHEVGEDAAERHSAGSTDLLETFPAAPSRLDFGS